MKNSPNCRRRCEMGNGKGVSEKRSEWEAAPSATKLQTAKEAETESIQRQTNAKGKFRLLGGVTKGSISVLMHTYICIFKYL